MDSEQKLCTEPDCEGGKEVWRDGRKVVIGVRKSCGCFECEQDKYFAQVFSITREPGARRSRACKYWKDGV